MKKLICIIFISAVFISATGCDQKKPEEVPVNLIAEEDYVHLLAELQLIRTQYNSRSEMVNLDSLKDVIYEKYEVSEDQFIESNRYYQKRVEGQIRRANKAIELLEAEMQKFEADSVGTDSAGVP